MKKKMNPRRHEWKLDELKGTKEKYIWILREN
jgi:hypothetical protein